MIAHDVTVLHGDCLTHLRSLPDASVHAIITDPPYGLADHKPAAVTAALVAWASGDRERVPTGRGFMGREWDSFVPPPAVWDECLRVLVPGGHLAVFAGSRTVDLMGLSIRLAGFEMRDGLAAWLYGSGFPKSLDVGKALDKAAGATREVVGVHRRHGGGSASSGSMSGDLGTASELPLTAPATDAAREWQGWGTALKPAHEPILLARKPLAGTVAANVLAHRAGAINVDACRVAQRADEPVQNRNRAGEASRAGRKDVTDWRRQPGPRGGAEEGRWPTNVVLAHHPDCGPDEAPGPCAPGCQVAALDEQSGTLRARGNVTRTKTSGKAEGVETYGSSRFFPTFRYCAKAPKRERPEVDGRGHPTVKPLGLVRWLYDLLVPPGGVVLDPFAGSGPLAEVAAERGGTAIVIERDEHSVALIAQRLARAERPAPAAAAQLALDAA